MMVIREEISPRRPWELRRLLSASLVALIAAMVACDWFRSSDATVKSLMERAKSDYTAARYNDAEREFRDLIRIRPKNAEAHYWLGRTLRDVGRTDEAMGELYRAHLLRNDYSDSLVLLSQLQVRSNDVQTVRWSADAANRVLHKKSDPASRAEAYYVLGLVQLRFNNLRGAADNFNQALSENPSHVGALCLLALLDADNGNVEGGEQRLKNATARDPGSFTLASALAEYCRMAKKPGEAEAQWRRVMALDPTNVPARINLVDLLCSLGREEEALEIARSLAQQPDSRYWQWHALLLFRRGRTDDAISELKQIADRKPQDESARLRLAAAMISVNRPKDALSILPHADDKNRRTVGDILMRAQIALNQNDVKQTAGLVSEAMSLDPASGQPHFFAARLPENSTNPFRTNYELGESLRLEPGFLPARLALVRRHLAERDIVTALGVLNACPKNQRQTYPVLVQRSWLMLAKGNWADAEAQISGITALEKPTELIAQQLIMQAAARRPVNSQTRAAELLTISQSSPQRAALAQVVGARPPSPEELQEAAINLGSQPIWETYRRDLLELPRGLLRSTLDPEGFLTLHTFGIWEPMIDAS
jgi:tetratricopeptide (TPR) repeat protein